MERKLTDKQELFAKEYLIDLNATQAAIRAGYSKKTAKEQGHRLLTNAHISALIQQDVDERAEKLEIDAEFVLKGILRVTQECEKENAYPVAALRGYELIGKHLKMFTDKHAYSTDPENPLQFKAKLPDDLKELITSMREGYSSE